MGDSSGDALDANLLEAWIQSVDDAAAELRAITGVKDVAVIGIRLGAMLAVSSAARGANIQDLVLWGPSATGRAMLREMRAFGNMESLNSEKGSARSAEAPHGFQIGGFLIAPETQRALESFNLSTLPAMPSRRILLLSRDNLPRDAKLIRALESSGSIVEVAVGEGFAAMMALVDEAIPPTATSLAIAEFLAKDLPQNREQSAGARTAEIGSSSPLEEKPPRTVITIEGTRVSETVYTIKHSSETIFGILSEPDPKVQASEWCILFLNPGPVRHTGPNRMWVEAARRWAAKGVSSLRLDLLGIGESGGEPALTTEQLYRAEMVEQLEAAMDSLRSRLGVRRFAVIGLCSGAFLAFQSVIRIPDIRAAMLLNPRLFFWDPEVDRRRLLRNSVKKLGKWGDWRRLARGGVPRQSITRAARAAFERIRATDVEQHRQIQPAAMADAWASIERNQSRVTLVFAEGEPLLQEMEEEGQMPPETLSHVRCVRVANCDHTFSPLWSQKMIHQLIDNELDEVFRESHANSAAGTREQPPVVSHT
jgi:pimeloyl-ACP methyl ester carboxylesterase